MKSELDSLVFPGYGQRAHPGSAVHVHAPAITPSAASSRRNLLAAQRWTGVALAVSAWVLILFGLANLVVATLHNREEEFGLGVDATARGAWVCLAGVLLAGAGAWLWAGAARPRA